MRTFRIVLAGALAALGISVVVAQPATAAVPANVSGFDQCQTQTSPYTQCSGWTNGGLNNSNHYAEDMVVPQRVLIDVTPGTDYVYSTTYDSVNGSRHGYDFLARWNYSVTGANPCQAPLSASLCSGTPSTFDMQSDPAVYGGSSVASHELAAADRQWTLYGGVITASSIPSTTSAKTTVTVTFHANPGVTQAVLLYGGHLAVGGPATAPRAWGTGNGASNFPGGSLSISVTGANKNNGINTNAIAPLPVAAFTITKTATPSSASPGDTVTYKVTVTNTGGQPGTATFTDDYDDNLTNVATPAGCTAGTGSMTCTTAPIDPGANQVLTYTAKLPTSFTSAGTGCSAGQFAVTNTATFASGTNVTSGTGPASATVCVSAASSFTVTKTVSGTRAPGGGLTYVVTVKNTGSAPGATTWTDNYDDRLLGVSTAVSAPAGNSCAPTTSGDREFNACATGTLQPGASQTFTYTATLPSTFSGAKGGGTCSSTQYRFANSVSLGTGSSTANVDVCVSAASAFTVTKTVSDTTATPGQTVTYHVTVTNTGIAAGSTTWSDDYDNRLTDVSNATSDNANGTACVPSGGAFTGCPTVELLAGGTETFTYTVKMPTSFTGASGTGGCAAGSYPVANTATTGSSTASKTVCVGAAANFTVDKSASTDTANPGDVVTYTVTVTNTGKAPGSTSFTDDYDDTLAPTLPTSTTPGASCTPGTGTFSCSTASVEAGDSVVFTYTAKMPTSFGPVSGSDDCATGTYPVSNTATLASNPASTAVVCVSATPSFRITKTVDKATASPGDTVTYTVTVFNDGDAAGATSFTDDFDDRLTPTDPSVGNCFITAGSNLTLTCTTAVIGAHSSQVFSYSATVPTAFDGGEVCEEGGYRIANTATLVGSDAAPAGAEVCVDASPRFTIDKTVSNSSPMPGDTVTYTVTVSNTGTASGSSHFTDDFDDALSPTTATSSPSGNSCTASAGRFDCATGVIPALGQQTFSYDVTVPDTFTGTPGTLGCGANQYAFKNVAELYGHNVDSSAKTDSVVICIGAGPKFTVKKVADDTTVGAGDTVTYTVTVTNEGNAAGATSFVDDYDDRLEVSTPTDCTKITDSGNEELSCDTGELVAGAHRDFTYTATMPATFTGVSGGGECGDGSYPVINTVQLAGADGDSDGVTVCTSAAPDLRVTKSADDTTVAAGDTVTYTLTVTNHGTAPGSTTVTDDYPDGLTLSDISNPSACTDNGDVLTCATGTIGAGDARSFSYQAAMPSAFDGDDSGSGGCSTGEFPVVNGVSISGSDSADSATVCVAAAPAWRVTKTADADVTTPGATVTYTITVENTGTASGVTTWSDDFDDRLTPSDAASNPAGNDCSPGSGAFADCATGEIAAGGQQVFTYSAVLPETFSGDPGAGCGPGEFAIRNSVSTASGATDGATVCVDASARFSITKTVDAESAEPGQTVNYTVTVKNLGAASGSTSFTDDYNDRLSPTLPVSDPSGGSCTDAGGSFSCSTGDIPGHGQLVFTYAAVLPSSYSSADSTEGCGDGQFAISNTVRFDEGPGDSVTTCVAASPDLVVTKSADKTDARPGDTVRYTVTVTNNGTAAGSTTLTDDYDNRLDPSAVARSNDGAPCADDGDTITCETGTISAGGSVRFTYSATLPASYTGVSGGGSCADGTYPVTNSVHTDGAASADSVTVCVTAAPSVTAVKSSSVDTNALGQQLITYTIGYTNLGDAEAIPATLSDEIPAGTRFESCTAGCTTNGSTGTATWDVGSIAALGGSGSVRLVVRVTSNQTCSVTNVAQLRIGSGQPISSNPVTDAITPQPDPSGAHAWGSSVGVDLKSKGIINVLLNGLLNPFGASSNSLVISRASSSQTGLGGPVVNTNSLLSAKVNGVLSAGVLTSLARSGVAQNAAAQTSTSEVANVCLVPVAGLCTVQVDAVRAVASTLATGEFAGTSSAGSEIVGLRVTNLLEPVNLNQTTKIPLNKAIFGANSYVAINERTSSAGLSGSSYAADLTVNMIHVKITGVLLGVQAVDLVVGQAIAHSDFPKTFVCAGSKHQEVSGHAYVASLNTNVLLADLTQGYVAISPLGGFETEHVAQVVLPAPDGAGLRAQVADSQSTGLVTGSAAASSSYAEVAGNGSSPVCLLGGAGCVVSATLIRAQAKSLAGGQGSLSTDNGTQFVDLKVLGIPISATPAPNTVITLPGIGFIVLNEQFCDNDGLANHSCAGARASGITVRSIHIVVTVLNKLLRLNPGVEVIAAEAHADSAFG